MANITKSSGVGQHNLPYGENLEQLFEALDDLLFILDCQGSILCFNPAVEKHLKYSSKELSEMTVFDVHPPEQREIVENVVSDLLSGKASSHSIPLMTGDGALIPAETKVTKGLWDGQDALFGVSRNTTRRTGSEKTFLQNRDDLEIQLRNKTKELSKSNLLLKKEIKKRRQAEKMAEKHRQELISIFNSIDEPIYVVHPKTYEILYANSALKGLFGEDIQGRKCYQVFQNIDRPCEYCSNPMIFGENLGKTYIQEFKNKITGRWYRCIDKAIMWPDGDMVRYEMALDIHEMKTAQPTIERRLRYEKMIADISSLALSVTNLEKFLNKSLEIMGNIIDVSRIYIFEHCYDTETMCNTFEWVADGITPEKDNLQKVPSKKLSWWTDMLFNNKIINYKDIENIPGESEKKTLRPQGIKSILVVPLFLKDKYYGFIGFDECRYHKDWEEEDIYVLKTISQIMSNTIKSKQEESALEASQQQQKAILDNIPDIAWLKDRESRFIAVNEPFGKACGVKPGNLVGKTDFDIWPKDLAKRYRADDKEIMLSGKRKQVEEPLIDKNGKKVLIETIKTPICDVKNKITGTTGIARDITERKRAEEEKRKLETQFQRAQKFESIGTLAGGIAHDFNNLLMAIQGNASLMLMDIDAHDPHYEKLKSIKKQIKSGVDLTRQLLGYARKVGYEVKAININQMVEETSTAFGRTRKQITIHKNLAEDLFAIKADKGQIEQVLLNLLINASDAMPGGGDLYLETKNVTHKDIKSELYKSKPGSYVRLTVRDTGKGMDKDTMERIFDPFFTTKEMGRGTGLGLASVYGIIKAHSGYIEVESELNQTTSFEIYLPATTKKHSEVSKPPEKPVKQTGTLLFVDDEAPVRKVCEKLLEKTGYRVMSARDGREAVELYRKNKDEIDIVLLDMIMPQMSGSKVYDRLKEINPEVKVLLSSGYSIDSEATEILNKGCSGFIQKPFDMKNLSAKIKEILDHKQDS